MLLALVVTALAVESAAAQYVPPATTPFPSPVVNPLVTMGLGGRGGLNPGLAYFGIVQPTQGFYNFESNQLNGQQQGSTVTRSALIGQTGTSARFMAYGGYFNNVGGVRLGLPVPPPGYAAPVPLGGRGLTTGSNYGGLGGIGYGGLGGVGLGFIGGTGSTGNFGGTGGTGSTGVTGGTGILGR